MLAALAVSATAASAQDIVLYQGENFTGQRFSSSESVNDLARVGFNDRASSVTIRGGSWQLCTDSYYRGQCATLRSGDYPSLRNMGLANAVSSIREIGWQGGGQNPGPGPAPGPAPGGGALVLFDAPGMTGRSFNVNGPIANLDGSGFNDRAQSAMIHSGTWQLCADANYQSSCEVLGPGQWSNLGGVTGQVSSLRPMPGAGAGPGPAPGPGQGGGWGGGRTRVVLYEGPNFQGRSYTVNEDSIFNLATAGFNDRASSIRVERGYWMFCTDANFMGDCRTFGPGDYPTLSWFSNRISSGRRISNDYPYNAPPQWRN
jgi:hypothetical protein